MPNNSSVEVDHIGFRTVSEKEYIAITSILATLGLTGIESQAPGHRRTFFGLTENEGGPRLEVQLWDMPEKRTPGVHVDVRSADPMATLRSISDQAEDWGEGEVPRGGVRMSDNFMIMARAN